MVQGDVVIWLVMGLAILMLFRLLRRLGAAAPVPQYRALRTCYFAELDTEGFEGRAGLSESLIQHGCVKLDGWCKESSAARAWRDWDYVNSCWEPNARWSDPCHPTHACAKEILEFLVQKISDKDPRVRKVWVIGDSTLTHHFNEVDDDWSVALNVNGREQFCMDCAVPCTLVAIPGAAFRGWEECDILSQLSSSFSHEFDTVLLVGGWNSNEWKDGPLDACVKDLVQAINP